MMQRQVKRRCVPIQPNVKKLFAIAAAAALVLLSFHAGTITPEQLQIALEAELQKSESYSEQITACREKLINIDNRLGVNKS